MAAEYSKENGEKKQEDGRKETLQKEPGSRHQKSPLSETLRQNGGPNRRKEVDLTHVKVQTEVKKKVSMWGEERGSGRSLGKEEFRSGAWGRKKRC